MVATVQLKTTLMWILPRILEMVVIKLLPQTIFTYGVHRYIHNMHSKPGQSQHHSLAGHVQQDEHDAMLTTADETQVGLT